MIRRLFAVFALAAMLLAGCRPTKPEPETPGRPLSHADLPVPAADAGPDSVAAEPLNKPVNSEKLPAKPGIFSGVGSLFSTPQGTARRQARKDARAAKPSAPLIQGKGAINAVNSPQVNGGNKPGPQQQADRGSQASQDNTDNTKAGQRGGAAATAPGATATATTEKGGWPWWAWLVLLGAEELITWLAFRMTVLSFLGGLFRRRSASPPTT